MKEYSVTEADLQAFESSISVNVAGAKNEILSVADKSGVSATPSQIKQISAGELVTMAGRASSIIILLESLIDKFGSNFQVTIILGGIAVAMTAIQAIESIVKSTAVKKESKGEQ